MQREPKHTSSCPQPGLSASAELRAHCQPGLVPTLTMHTEAEDRVGRLVYGALGQEVRAGAGPAPLFHPDCLARHSGSGSRLSQKQSLVHRAGAQVLGL